MFVNCPHCQALIATDPATDLPPVKCPRCAAGLREKAVAATDVPPATGSRTDTAIHTTTTGADTAATAPAASALPAIEPMDANPAAEPGIATGRARADLPTAIAAVISPIATLLKPATQAPAEPPATAPEPAPEDKATVPPAPESGAATAADAAAGTPQMPIEPAAATPAPAGDTAGAPQTTDKSVDESSTQSTEPAAADTPDATAAQPSPVVAAAATGTSEPGPRSAGTATALPSFARTGTLPHHGFDWKTATVATALALLLSLQLLLAGRAQLAGDARWRPLVSTLCSAFGCTLPPWREPAAFTVLARDVRPHSSLPGVLRVTATLRNDARWPQPWPRLRLTLSDVDGNPVAARDFAAREYLGARSPPPQIASGQSAAFAMDIVEPESRSVAFDFELH